MCLELCIGSLGAFSNRHIKLMHFELHLDSLALPSGQNSPAIDSELPRGSLAASSKQESSGEALEFCRPYSARQSVVSVIVFERLEPHWEFLGAVSGQKDADLRLWMRKCFLGEFSKQLDPTGSDLCRDPLRPSFKQHGSEAPSL